MAKLKTVTPPVPPVVEVPSRFTVKRGDIVRHKDPFHPDDKAQYRIVTADGVLYDFLGSRQWSMLPEEQNTEEGVFSLPTRSYELVEPGTEITLVVV